RPGAGGRRAKPRGKMKEAAPFPRHRILVAAGKIEGAIGAPRQRGRQRHEAVIAVEDDQRLRIAHRAGDGVERSARARRVEKDLADEDEIMAAAARGGAEALGKARERFGGDALDGDEPVFLEAGDLAREGMKFAVAREE